MTLEKLILQATDESLLGEENWDLTMQIVDKLDAKPHKQVFFPCLSMCDVDDYSHFILKSERESERKNERVRESRFHLK